MEVPKGMRNRLLPCSISSLGKFKMKTSTSFLLLISKMIISWQTWTLFQPLLKDIPKIYSSSCLVFKWNASLLIDQHLESPKFQCTRESQPEKWSQTLTSVWRHWFEKNEGTRLCQVTATALFLMEKNNPFFSPSIKQKKISKQCRDVTVFLKPFYNSFYEDVVPALYRIFYGLWIYSPSLI